jgi:uncharacterized protein
MSPDKVICDIYKSPNDSELYLYVKKEDGLTRVPEALLEKFGTPKHSMTLLLTPQKKLARANIEKVLVQLQDEGFYLQLPPLKDPEVLAINAKNSKLNL